MTGKIHRLPDHIANQIAAGEVIQRPASVIKELMENAIDAGASSVIVNIKDAGKTLIQIIDNGSGMTAHDAELCFERHATSKISKAEDLFQLHTKGFRGEALASIAAIAHVELKTKTAESETGTFIRIEGSQITEKSETVCPQGTQFEIKNLFYNVPARRNFLKSEKVEFGHINDEFIRVALAHPEISFKLAHNGTTIYELNDAVLRKRIVDVLGRNTNDRLVPIDESTEIVQLKGFVLKPEFSRKTRGEQFLFVNDRFFKSSYFNHAINKAYDGLLREGYFPSYFLYLDVDPSKIDVNVHPTKTEIKFEEEAFIYSILVSSIRQALGKFNIAPTLDFERESSFDIPLEMRTQPAVEPEIKVNPSYNPFKSAGSTTSSNKAYTEAIKAQGFGQEDLPKESDWSSFYTITEEEDENKTEDNELQALFTSDIQFLSKAPFLIVQNQNGFFLVHAQRAFEHIVYTKSFNNFTTNPLNSQTLLFPIEMDCSKSQLVLLEQKSSLMRQFGFQLELSDQQIEIHAVPDFLEAETITHCMEDILELLSYQDPNQADIAQSILASMARAASHKKMDLKNKESVAHLLEELDNCESQRFTHDGRLIVKELTLEELALQFKKNV